MRPETHFPTARRLVTKSAVASVMVFGLALGSACGADKSNTPTTPTAPTEVSTTSESTTQQTPSESASNKGTPTVPETTSATPSSSPAKSSAISTESAAKQESATTNPKNTTESDDKPSVNVTKATTNGTLELVLQGVKGAGPFSNVSCFDVGGVTSITADDTAGVIQGLGIVFDPRAQKVESMAINTFTGFALVATGDTAKVAVAGNIFTFTGSGEGVDENDKPFSSRRFMIQVTCK